MMGDREMTDDDPLAPARGILLGVLIGALMWAGLIWFAANMLSAYIDARNMRGCAVEACEMPID